MSKHFQLIWQQHNYCAFRPLPMTTAVFSKRSPAGLWLTSEENALMTAVALCFSWDLCTVLHDWVRAGQSNGIPMDLWFMGFFPGLFFFYQNVRYFLWVGTYTSDFANVTSEQSPPRKELWEWEWQMFLPGMCTQTGETMCAWRQRRVWAYLISAEARWVLAEPIQTKTSRKAQMCYGH